MTEKKNLSVVTVAGSFFVSFDDLYKKGRFSTFSVKNSVPRWQWKKYNLFKDKNRIIGTKSSRIRNKERDGKE